MQNGACALSCRILSQQLKDGPHGAALASLLLAAAAETAWPRTRRSERAKQAASHMSSLQNGSRGQFPQTLGSALWTEPPPIP
eukprot:5296610-Pyramimonas_sp.AAC.1